MRTFLPTYPHLPACLPFLPHRAWNVALPAVPGCTTTALRAPPAVSIPLLMHTTWTCVSRDVTCTTRPLPVAPHTVSGPAIYSTAMPPWKKNTACVVWTHVLPTSCTAPPLQKNTPPARYTCVPGACLPAVSCRHLHVPHQTLCTCTVTRLHHSAPSFCTVWVTAVSCRLPAVSWV